MVAGPSSFLSFVLWKTLNRTFDLTERGLIMGVLNVTPDSFSEYGRNFDPEAAVAHALQMAEEGAEIIDIGGESTRPGAAPVEEREELRRVLPVIERLAGDARFAISIDTMKPAVAAAAVERGAAIINDVTGLRAVEMGRSRCTCKEGRRRCRSRLNTAMWSQKSGIFFDKLMRGAYGPASI